ncbi:response regulator transcription factor [Flagellimonas lutaonensis]|uniref:response regulator transcription factor n=1 Tax=Flagellimonas lutaonensis TaxID=516051 RepID=UPI000698FAC2|nr:response regulator [Allomuricauda lutaonensis]
MSHACILIIEDDTCILNNTAELLQLEGYTVMTASDGKIGMEKILHSPPDLIICDLLMPKMDGLTLLETLGKHPKLKKIPFIFSSAKSEKTDIEKGLAFGADDYLVKPFGLDELLKSIKKCLSTKGVAEK